MSGDAAVPPGPAVTSDDGRLTKAQRLNDRAFACAFIAVFLVPMGIGIFLSVAAIVLGLRSRREGRALGADLSKSPVTFGIVVTVAWFCCFIPIMIALLIN